MTDVLPSVDINPEGDPEWVVIWLHGLGADGHDFEPIVPALGITGHAVRFVFPHAPSIPVTLNGGMSMPAWYDIRDGDLSKRNDEDGIRVSAQQIEALLAREKQTVPADHIVLVVTHDLRALEDLSRVVFLEEGRLRSQGSHRELLESDAHYARHCAPSPDFVA